MSVSFASLQVGDTLPELVLPPVDRTMLALFAGASGDHNPAHIDIDFARRAGMPDVIAHGMLGMAWLGRLLTRWVPQIRLVCFEVRFCGITKVGQVLTCRGTVVEKLDQVADRGRVRVELRATDQNGEDKMIGEALTSLP